MGYKFGTKLEKELDPIFNPISKKHEWISTGYLGIYYQAKPSIIPSTSGNLIAAPYLVKKIINSKNI